MTQDDVLFGYRLQRFDLAARTTVSHVCRTFEVHRSTYSTPCRRSAELTRRLTKRQCDGSRTRATTRTGSTTSQPDADAVAGAGA
jgi:hypothetical protein